MSNYYFRRATNLETSQLIDIIMDIDNGYYDIELDKNDWFDKVQKFRIEIIEVLIKRYEAHHLYNNKNDDELNKAYRLYIRHYTI
jgi:hypothetical protein